MQITCPHCDKRLRVTEEMAGKRVRCAHCNSVIDVPAAARDAGKYSWVFKVAWA